MDAPPGHSPPGSRLVRSQLCWPCPDCGGCAPPGHGVWEQCTAGYGRWSVLLFWLFNYWPDNNHLLRVKWDVDARKGEIVVDVDFVRESECDSCVHTKKSWLFECDYCNLDSLSGRSLFHFRAIAALTTVSDSAYELPPSCCSRKCDYFNYCLAYVSLSSTSHQSYLRKCDYFIHWFCIHTYFDHHHHRPLHQHH